MLYLYILFYLYNNPKTKDIKFTFQMWDKTQEILTFEK